MIPTDSLVTRINEFNVDSASFFHDINSRRKIIMNQEITKAKSERIHQNLNESDPEDSSRIIRFRESLDDEL
jgi:hypothetical protein